MYIGPNFVILIANEFYDLMKRTFTTILGALILLMAFYTLVTLVQIIFGWTDTKLSEIALPLVIIGIVFIAMVIGIYKKDKPNTIQEITTQQNAQNNQIKERAFDPAIDKLKFKTYEQKVKTWWYDSDGDLHNHSVDYACLRFYENGQVIGSRSRGILKIEEEESFVYKGQWKLDKNKLSITLKKVKNIDDSLEIYISPEDRRNMKYAGSIADDSSLIKEGDYRATIKGERLDFGNFDFYEFTPSRLIITASEDVCDQLKDEFINHHLVLGAFINTGNWYTNGETGSEWFTVTFESRYELRDLLEKDIKKSGHSYSNLFWG